MAAEFQILGFRHFEMIISIYYFFFYDCTFCRHNSKSAIFQETHFKHSNAIQPNLTDLPNPKWLAMSSVIFIESPVSSRIGHNIYEWNLFWRQIRVSYQIDTYLPNL